MAIEGCNFVNEDLIALETALAKGVRRVKYTDKEIEYRSVDEMLKIRDLIRNCLGLNGDQRGTRRIAEMKKGIC